VNLETLYWVKTPATVSLGTVALLGHQVTLSATARSVSWSFGDGATGVSEGPGRPFGPNDHCHTATCPDWFGHTYTKTGTFTVNAVVNWTGTYSADGQPAQPIQGTVAGPAATIPMQVLQARGVLVPNPTSTR